MSTRCGRWLIPDRVAILLFLLAAPTRTATECAAEIGVSPSACSYHLRELERFGYIERAERQTDGRTRPWRAAAVGFSLGDDWSDDSPDGRAARLAIGRAELAENHRLIERFVNAAGDLEPRWQAASDFHNFELMVTPDELAELNELVATLLRPFRATGARHPARRRGGGPRGVSGVPAPRSMMLATPHRPLWRQRNFRIAWSAGFINDTGDWVLTVALPVFVFVETRSGAATAILFVCQLGPAALLGPIAGSIVDRVDLRRCLIATNLAQAVTLLPLLAVTDERVWPAYLVVATQSALTQLNNPANIAVLTRVVTDHELTRANAALAASASLARLLGAPLGGALVAWSGLAPIVLIDTASFALVAAAVAFITADTSPLADPDHADRLDLRAGWRVTRANPPLTSIVSLHGLAQIAQGSFVVIFVAFVVETLGDDGAALGLIRGTMAIGALIGSVLIAKLAARVDPPHLYGLGLLGMGVVSLAFWNAPTLTTALAVYVTLFALSGIPGSAVTVGLFTTIQTRSPRHAIGRVTGLLNTTEAIGIAVGSIATGVLIDRLPLRPLLDAQATIYLAAGTIALVHLRGRRPRSARHAYHLTGRTRARSLRTAPADSGGAARHAGGVRCRDRAQEDAMSIADDPRIDPRIKAWLANMPTTTQGDVASREVLLDELNRPEAVAQREQMVAMFELLDNEDVAPSKGLDVSTMAVHVESRRQHRQAAVHPPAERRGPALRLLHPRRRDGQHVVLRRHVPVVGPDHRQPGRGRGDGRLPQLHDAVVGSRGRAVPGRAQRLRGRAAVRRLPGRRAAHRPRPHHRGRRERGREPDAGHRSQARPRR